MKCWRCGKEIDDGAEKCLYCNADQRRSAPATDIGKALRQLYDHYGAEAVLTNSVLLSNGLADVVTDSVSVNIKKIKNQMKMAMEVGLGNLYKEQLTIGKPDAGFVSRVKTLLTEDAGLNEKTAADIIGWFDEMIGWAPEKAKTAVPEPKKARLEEKMSVPLPEIEEAKEPETPLPASSEPKKSLTPLWIILAALICVLAGVFFYWNNRHVMQQAVMSTQEALAQLTSVAATQEELDKAAEALAATQTKIAEPTATNTPTKTSTPKPTATKAPTLTPTPSIGIPRITMLNQEGGKIKLSWTNVAGAIYYEIYSSRNNYSYTIIKRITNSLSATIDPPEDAGTIYCKIRACSGNICGGYSDVYFLNYQKPTATPKPTATKVPTKTPTPRPTNTPTPSIGIPRITMLNQEGGKNKLSWTNVAGASYYEIYSSRNNYSYTIIKRITNSLSVTIDPPEDAGTIYYKIRACSGNICGGYSDVYFLNYQKPTATPKPTATKVPTKTPTPRPTNTPAPTAIPKPLNVKVWDEIIFGQYEQDKFPGADPIKWQVLMVQNGRALVISKDGLETKPYHNTDTDITWEDCDLRKWLNGEFYDSAFSSLEKRKIVEVWNSNPDSPFWKIKGGNDTKDKVFLLSIDEADKYFPRYETRVCQATYHAIQNGAWLYGSKDKPFWYLRSPGRSSTIAALINDDGDVDLSHGRVNDDDCVVRPALWLDLSTLSESSAVVATATPTPKPKAGDVIHFGRYEQDGYEDYPEEIEWIVLTVENGRAFLISKYALEEKSYNETDTDVTWETCTLRKWLNGDFYNNAFTSSEKTKILEVWNSNPDNSLWGTEGGNDTKDKVFLLSEEEVERYMRTDSSRQCRPTNKPKGLDTVRGYCNWWLRSPGHYSYYGSYVSFTGYTLGDYVTKGRTAVRPALWLIL